MLICMYMFLDGTWNRCISLQLVAYDNLLVSYLDMPICLCSLKVVECVYMCIFKLYDIHIYV
jgi:hypothetical protein